MAHSHHHAHACDCPTHRAAAAAERERSSPREAAATQPPSWWASVLPVLVCAVCPVCLTGYAKLFSILGLGLGLTEEQHVWLLATAVSVSVASSAYRSWLTKRVWPLAVAASGALLMAAGHLLGEVPVLEWSGALVMLAGGLAEQRRVRRLAAEAVAF